MTRLTRLTALTLATLGLPAFAMGSGGTDVDANGDGLLSVSEVQAVYPEITAETFSTMDLNGDGALDATEVEAATEAGMMPEAPADEATSADG
jgi:hypothetical protein